MTAAASDQPGWMDPELATLTRDRFSDPGWIFERKLDGERCLAFRSGTGVRLMTRNQKEDTSTYPEITQALIAQRAGDFIIDGEIVAFDDGQTRFARLQQRLGVRHPGPDLLAEVPVFYYIFDVLWADGRDLRPLPLRERKRILRDLLTFAGPLRFTEHVDTDGEAYFRQACASGWEGVIAKRADAPYHAGRSRDWLKFKCESGQEFVIGGFTDPRGTRTGFGALLLGYYDPGHQLVYAGKVGTGFSQRTLDSLHTTLAAPGARPSPVRPRQAAAVRCALGPATPGRRGGLQRMDDRRGTAPPPVPGPAGRQGPRGCRPRDATGHHPVTTPTVSAGSRRPSPGSLWPRQPHP